jgi:GT2 family glycosyltransferase
MVRRETFVTLGGFDPSFYMFYEDSDIGWRFNLAGQPCLCVSRAVAVHATVGHVDTRVQRLGDQTVFHYTKNRLRMLLKNYSTPRLLAYLPPYLIYAIADAILRAPRAVRWRALLWNLTHFGDTLRLRKEIQAARRVTDRQLDSMISPGWLPPERLTERMERVRHLYGSEQGAVRGTAI